MTYYKTVNEISETLGIPDAFVGNQSAGAKQVYEILISKYGVENVESEKTWDWLKNDMTGHNMYVDFYIKTCKISVEYDGVQHFKPSEFFKIDEDEFEKYKYRDTLKNKLLLSHSIGLIRIPYTYTIEEIKHALLMG
jgi:hypothetical protein